MKKNLFLIVMILLGLSLVSGFFYTQVKASPFGTLYIAILYMPIPLYTLLIYSLISGENTVKKYVTFKELSVKKFMLPVLLFLSWVLLILLASYFLPSLFPDTFADFIISSEDFLRNLEGMVGEETAKTIKMPFPPLALIPIGLVAALVAGYSINLIFAFTEEILWRGYLWDAFEGKSILNYTLFTGVLWGLWHAPIIATGYNYGTENGLYGIPMFVIFCTVFSFFYTILNLRTRNVIFSSALHGMFNAFAGIFVVLLSGINPFIDGAIGFVSIGTMILLILIFIPLFKIDLNQKIVKL